jgi:hypothetical protein
MSRTMCIIQFRCGCYELHVYVLEHMQVPDYIDNVYA